MDFFCQFQDLAEHDIPISSWEDAILAPKNLNIPHSTRPHCQHKSYHRKQIFNNKRRSYRKVAMENIQNSIEQYDFSSVQGGKKQLSNISKLKYKIQNIDKDLGRWEEGFMKKVERIEPIPIFQRRVQSGIFKPYTQEEPMQTVSLDRTKFSSRSINNSRGVQQQRPVSCRPPCMDKSHQQQPNLKKFEDRERVKTIHSKPRLKSNSYSRKRSSRGSGQMQTLTINQLQSSKVNHIIRCLSKRK